MLRFLAGLLAEARGREPVSVAIEVQGCSRPMTQEVKSLVAVELRAFLVSQEEVAPSTTRARLRCDSSNGVEIHVVAPSTGAEAERRVSLSDVEPKHQARTAALALAESVKQVWEEKQPQRSKPASPPPDSPPEPLRDSQPEHSYRLFATARWLPGGPGGSFPMYGGSLSFIYGRKWGFLADGGFTYTTVKRESGSVRVHAGDALAALSLGGGGSVPIKAALGLRGGCAVLAGQAGISTVRASTVEGCYVGPAARLEATLNGPLVPVMAFEGGYLAGGVIGRVRAEEAVALRGIWLGFSLGIAWSPR